MRLTVFAPGGGTGTKVVRQALDAGHQVTVVVRDPARLTVPPTERLTIIPADVTDPEAIIATLDGADAAVAALGHRPLRHLLGYSATTLTQATRAILAAMDKTGVRRLVAVSTGGLFSEPGEPALMRHLVKPLLRALLRSGRADAHRMEDLIAESPADWTIMRPWWLLNTARRPYRVALDRYVGARIGQADLADAILRTLADPGTVGHRVNVGY